MRPTVLVKEIRQVETGFIVEARWPVGGEPAGYGEVVCYTFQALIRVLQRCAIHDDGCQFATGLCNCRLSLLATAQG